MRTTIIAPGPADGPGRPRQTRRERPSQADEALRRIPAADRTTKKAPGGQR